MASLEGFTFDFTVGMGGPTGFFGASIIEIYYITRIIIPTGWDM